MEFFSSVNALSSRLASKALHYARKFDFRRRMIRVRLDRLLIGRENGIEAATWARMTGDPMRPSTPLSESPHVKLLQEFQRFGSQLFDDVWLRKTAYYRNALASIDIVGHYFEAKSEEQIVNVAKRFVDAYSGNDGTRAAVRQIGQSQPGAPIRVRKIRESDFYQIIDGHHRLAIAYIRGHIEQTVLLQPPSVLTPLQSLLSEVQWLRGRRELYQPVNAPELRGRWVLVRKCSDRLKLMERFLESRLIFSSAVKTYLDVASSYGWFVDQMGRRGFLAHGVERDPIAASVGPIVYGISPSQITRSDCIRFLRGCKQKFDVVSCFSLLHHFVMGNGSVDAETLIRLLDKVTGDVLFLDTGQSHERWYRATLANWNPEFIEGWLRKNTSFREIYQLGVDEDAVPPFQDSFGRMLFACVR